MPTDQFPPRRGWSFPAGASLATDPADGCTGVNFSVTSHHATAVTVLLFGQGNGDTLATIQARLEAAAAAGACLVLELPAA